MDIVLNILLVILLIIGILVKPIYWFLAKDHVPVPKVTDSILLTSAKQLAKSIRQRKLTSEQVVAAFIKRIKQVNPVINAVVQHRFSQALQEAKQVDKFLESCKDLNDLEHSKPLLGVPMTVKESCSVKGMSLAGGSKSRENVVADQDGEAVKNLKEAGVIILAVTNTVEFCLGFESINHVTGKTCNPYNTSRTAAGSSGGEGAIIGSGASIIGIGSDLAGSNRLPGLYNGIFAHKTTPHIVPMEGHFPGGDVKEVHDYLVLGPLTRYAEDLPLVLSAMAGKNSHLLKLEEEVQVKDLRIFYMKGAGVRLLGLHRVQGEITKSVERAVECLESIGCRVQAKKFKGLKYGTEMVISTFTSIKGLPEFLTESNNMLKNILVEFYRLIRGRSKFSLSTIFYHLLMFLGGIFSKEKKIYLMKAASNLKTDIISNLQTNGVLIFPTFPEVTHYHFESFFKLPYVMYTAIFNVLGLPSCHVPMGLDKNGLPIGVQVIAAPYQDRLCLAVARELERIYGGWVPPYKQ